MTTTTATADACLHPLSAKHPKFQSMTTTTATADAPVVFPAPVRPTEEQPNQELQSRELSSAELLVPAPIVIYDQPQIRRHVIEDCSSLEVARQRRTVGALRAVVSSVHEDIGASQTRPARVKTSHRMPDCLTCKLNGQALAVMLCEDDGGGSFAFPPGPILRRQWD
jgi:hypothetical protein